MAKLERKHFLFAASWEGTTWDPLGVDNDDLSLELNPDVETSKNVLGETRITHAGYEPELDMDTYYADPDRSLYEKMLANAISRTTDEESIKGKFGVGVFGEETKDADSVTGEFWEQEAYFIPQSIGGDTAGAAIPFNVYPIGIPEKKSITYVRSTRKITVSEAGG